MRLAESTILLPSLYVRKKTYKLNLSGKKEDTDYLITAPTISYLIIRSLSFLLNVNSSGLLCLPRPAPTLSHL